MQEYKPNFDVGVIVGRFQVHKLHNSHKDLIQSVADRCARVIIILGISPARATVRNPLDFESRRQMIQESFPDAIILCLRDCLSDIYWSNNLDAIIGDVVPLTATVGLFGTL